MLPRSPFSAAIEERLVQAGGGQHEFKHTQNLGSAAGSTRRLNEARAPRGLECGYRPTDNDHGGSCGHSIEPHSQGTSTSGPTHIWSIPTGADAAVSRTVCSTR